MRQLSAPCPTVSRRVFSAEFLREHGTEAVNMLFTEFDMEDALEVRYEEGRNRGKSGLLSWIIWRMDTRNYLKKNIIFVKYGFL